MTIIASHYTSVVTVEPQVGSVTIRVANISVTVRRTGTEDAPTVSIAVGDRDGSSVVAEVPVVDPFDGLLRDYYERMAGYGPRR